MIPFDRFPSLGVFFVAVILASCDSQPEPGTTALDLPETPYSYDGGSNSHVATLGRVLFYDQNLSINNSISCATCHKQVLGFADNAPLSKGFENRLTSRNSMPIQNLGSAFGFTPLFWDGRENNLHQMVLKPIVNHVEMGINDLDKLSLKLQSIPYYQDLFQNAYGSPEVTGQRLSESLATFLLNIRSNNTKFDRNNMGTEELSAIELRGKELFFDTYDCNNCHVVQNPSGYIEAGTFANIGLEEVYSDPGLATVTKNSFDEGKFKIPSLRNVTLTAPYMHDGRFETLEEVLDFYSEDISTNDNLDFRLRDQHGAPMKFNIPESDKQAMIAFLNTLTDASMISDPRFSNPFKSR
jgi:cytochrome c peroxidase